MARQVTDGLRRLGLHLGEDDLRELVDALVTDSGHGLPIVRWETWHGFFASGVPGWADSAAERRRRLVLQRLLGALQGGAQGGGDATHRLVSWLAARDGRRTGRVSVPEFCAGLRANGVLVADADAALAAVEIDPEGGGTTLAYMLLPSLVASNRAACPMPS